MDRGSQIGLEEWDMYKGEPGHSLKDYVRKKPGDISLAGGRRDLCQVRKPRSHSP